MLILLFIQIMVSAMNGVEVIQRSLTPRKQKDVIRKFCHPLSGVGTFVEFLIFCVTI